jgi:hypothetical protein
MELDYQECDHVFLRQDDGRMVCSKCDMMTSTSLEQGFDNSKNYAGNGTSKTSVLDKVEGIPKKVKNHARANMIKKGEYNVKKVRDDKKNTFKEIYLAYQELKIKFDPNVLAEKLSLSRKDVNCCLKALSGTSLVPSIHDDDQNLCSIVIIHPADYIPELCEKNKLEKHMDKLKKLTEQIVAKKDILLSSKPKHVACAIIKKYCDENQIPAKSFGKNNNLSDNALKKSMKEIEEFF